VAFFGKKTASERAREVLRESRRLTEARLTPFHRIIKGIIHATEECRKRITPFIRRDTELDRQKCSALVSNEFLFFFLHMTDRIAFSSLGADRANKLREIILPEIFGITVDSHFLDAPVQMKKEFRSVLYTDARKAALDYVPCTEWLSKEEPYTGDSLLSKLALKVMNKVAAEVDPNLVIEIIKAASKEMDNTNLVELIEATRAIVADFEIPRYDLWDDPDYVSKLKANDEI
jgi:hypothetical protein